MILRQEFYALTDALDKIEPDERASTTRVIASALIQLLPQDERITTLDFLNQRNRGQLQ
jgi:hypothetical protein